MTMKSGTKFGDKSAYRLKHEKFGKFSPEHTKVSKLGL